LARIWQLRLHRPFLGYLGECRAELLHFLVGAYGDANVFVLPSQNENFGNTAAEAAACGTPVVITKNCGVARLLEGVAGIVVAHETEAVALAVKQLLSEPDLSARFSEGGKQAGSRLGWDEPVTATENLYSELAARRQVVGQSAG